MGLLDFLKTEKRESQPFTEAIQAAIFEQASGSAPLDVKALGALEVAAGFWARAFASANITPENPLTRSLTPSILAMIGRELCRRGETLFKITVTPSGKVRLIPAGSWDIRGGTDPDSWIYRVDLFGASRHRTEYLPGPGLLHFRYAVDPANPWLGLSPLQYARDSGKLAAALEKRLGEEAAAPVGNLLPVPQDGGDGSEGDSLVSLKSDLRNARGRTLLVPTTAEGWGEGMAAAPRQDWQQKRIGADPPEALEKIRGAVGETILACCGVPVELAELGQGTAAREAWRRFLHATIDPLGKLVAEELTEKFEFPVSLSFDSLMASDISGRARAFQSMVGGGMDITKAAALSGLMMAEE